MPRILKTKTSRDTRVFCSLCVIQLCTVEDKNYKLVYLLNLSCAKLNFSDPVHSRIQHFEFELLQSNPVQIHPDRTRLQIYRVNPVQFILWSTPLADFIWSCGRCHRPQAIPVRGLTSSAEASRTGLSLPGVQRSTD